MLDNDYINYIFDTYSNTILKISYTYLKNKEYAEDILQDVILKIIKKQIIFEDKQNEKHWIIRVTINLCKDYLKSAWFRKKVEFENQEEVAYEKEDNVLEEVLNLPEKYKTVIYLFYYENYSIKEISKILNKKEATIGTHIARAKKILEEKLKGGWDND